MRLPFDRRQVRRNRDRAAAGFAEVDFLVRWAGQRLAERLADVRRDFPLVLDLGCAIGGLAGLLPAERIGQVVQADFSPAMARAASGNGRPTLAADEEALPFAPASFDLVVSAMGLHWVNDLPGTLAQIRHCLKPDGLFLAFLPGGETLPALRRAWLAAEAEVLGGASPRVAPFVELRDAAALLQRAGFALPVADREVLPVSYGQALKLFAELKAMGEGNALAERKRGLTGKETLFAAAHELTRLAGRPDGRLALRFELLSLTGWAPSPDQPQALRPGSAAQRLSDALETDEKKLP